MPSGDTHIAIWEEQPVGSTARQACNPCHGSSVYNAGDETHGRSSSGCERKSNFC